MHPGLKRLAEAALRYGGPARLARLRTRGRALILGYHNVVPDDAAIEGDRSLHLSQRRFAEQMDLLARLCRVVPLESVLEPDGRDPRPRVAVTFDDAYRGTMTLGVEELARRGFPATVFVAPGFVGGGAFWWDALTEPGRAGPAPDLRRRGLAEFRGEDAAIRHWAATAAIPSRSPATLATVASEEELHAATRYPRLTLASHSWSHPNLSSLRDDELQPELERPLAWLRERFPRVIPWLAYPYGLASPAVETAAAASYQAAVRIDGGWVPRRPTNRFALPRLNVPAGLSADGFVLRISALVAA
jgi:peptidoglycan/xylan/chitin deacetylase (PgdA/CDA1 family)